MFWQLFSDLEDVIAPQYAQKRPVCLLGLQHVTGLVGVVADNEVCLILLVEPHNPGGLRGRTSSCQKHYEQQRSRYFHHHALPFAILLPPRLRACLKDPQALELPRRSSAYLAGAIRAGTQGRLFPRSQTNY